MSTSAKVVAGTSAVRPPPAQSGSSQRMPSQETPSSSTSALPPATSGPPHWGVSLHPCVFRVETTGRDILFNIHRNGALRYYYHLLRATSSLDPSSAAAPPPVADESSRTSPPPSPASPSPDPALTQRVVQRCLRQSIPQLVSFRYTVATAHHVATSANGGGSAAQPRVFPTDQLVGQMRSSRLNSIEALLPKHSPLPPIPIQRTLFPLSPEEEDTRDATVRALLSEEICHRVAVSLEQQLHEARVSQRHQCRLFSFRAADPTREPTNVYSGGALDIVVGAGECSGLYHSPLVSGLEVALASMTVGETAGFFINAPQSFAFSAPDLDLAVPDPATAEGGEGNHTSAELTVAYNEAVPGIVRRGADRVLYYKLQLTRRVPAVFAFPPCRGLTLYTVPRMSVQQAHRQLVAQAWGRSTLSEHAMQRLREHDKESIQRLRAAAHSNPFSFFLFTNLTRVGSEPPIATFCAVDPEAHTRRTNLSSSGDEGTDADEEELIRLRAQHLVAAEAGIQAALLGDPSRTTAAANRAFAMAVSMVMGSSTLFDVPRLEAGDDDDGGSCGTSTKHVTGTTQATHSPATTSALDEVYETHGLLTHTLEAAMNDFGLTSTAAALRDVVASALSAPVTPNLASAAPQPTAVPALSPSLDRPTDSPPRAKSSSVPLVSPAPDTVLPRSAVDARNYRRDPPLPDISTGTGATTTSTQRGLSGALAVEYERWLTAACRYLDTRFLPCPRGAALVQLRLARFEPLTEQLYDLLPPPVPGGGPTGAAATPGATKEGPTAQAGSMVSPVCSLAIPCWLSLALTQQLHHAPSVDPHAQTTTTTATTTTSPPPAREYCVSSVRVQAPVGLPMDQSDEEAFMIHLFHQLRAHTVASFEDCRGHLQSQLDQLAVAVAAAEGSCVESSSGEVACGARPTDKLSAQTKAAHHGSEAVLAAFPCEERASHDAAATTTTTSATTTGTGARPAPETAPLSGGLRTTPSSSHVSSSPSMEAQYHLESRLVSAAPTLRKRHFFFLNPKTSLGHVRALLSRVCTLLHIYDARNPYRKGPTRTGRASLSSSTSSRQASHFSALEEPETQTTDAATRQYSSPLAGGSRGTSWSHRQSQQPPEGGRRPPMHPALAGWAPLEAQCAKLTTRLDKVREIPEHETMVDQLLLGPTVCTQAPSPPPPPATQMGSETAHAPVRTWANVLAAATFFSTDERGRLLPEQREKAVLRRCLFKVFELAYLAIVLLTFGTEESQLRPSSFLPHGGYDPYFEKPATSSTATTTRGELTVHLDERTDIGSALQGLNAPYREPGSPSPCRPGGVVDPHVIKSNQSSTADLLAASMAASTSVTTSPASLRVPSDNSKRRRYQYLAECYQYVALTFWEMLVPYLLTPSAMLQRADAANDLGANADDPLRRAVSYTSSTTRKAPIANMLSACGLDAVTYALLYDPHEASLWSLRARFLTQQGLYEEAQSALEIAMNLTTAEKAEGTRVMRRRQRAERFSPAPTATVASQPAAAVSGSPTLPVPHAVGSLADDEAALQILEDRLAQLEEQTSQLKALRAATARERRSSQ